MPLPVTGRGFTFICSSILADDMYIRINNKIVMPLSQVHIFAKNRDAAVPLKGYDYQHLKTMETWLLNRINKVDEVIYCDREEDIFQRDLNTGNVTLRQLHQRQVQQYSTSYVWSNERHITENDGYTEAILILLMTLTI